MNRSFIALLLLSSVIVMAQEPRVSAGNPQFDALKSLAGEWQAKLSNGRTGTSNYRVVSDSSAIMLEMNTEGEAANMITMFHPDGQKTVATHYCSMGNQPRMVAQPSADTKKIQFTFKDITNDDRKSGSMRDLTIVLLDKDHHDQIWTWQDGSGKSETSTFHLVRTGSPAAQGK